MFIAAKLAFVAPEIGIFQEYDLISGQGQCLDIQK